MYDRTMPCKNFYLSAMSHRKGEKKNDPAEHIINAAGLFGPAKMSKA